MYIQDFAKHLLKLEQNSSRLKLKQLLQELFNEIHSYAVKEKNQDLYFVSSYFLTGKIVPEFIPIEFGLQEKTVFEILKSLQQKMNPKLSFKKAPDLGDLWYDFALKNTPLSKNSDNQLIDVYNKLLELALISGKGAMARKSDLLAKILMSLDPLSGKYVIRLILGKLRLGVNAKSLLDAVVDHLAQRIESEKTFVENVPKTNKQIKDFLTYFYGVTNDIGFVVFAVFELPLKELFEVSALPGIPMASQLAEREKNIQHIFARIPSPVLEPKYDGLRGQVHILDVQTNKLSNVTQDITNRVWYKAYQRILKQEDNISLVSLPIVKERVEYMIFSRNATNLSKMFPEIEHDAILLKQFLMSKNKQWLTTLLLRNYQEVLSKKVLFKEDLDKILESNTHNVASKQDFKFTQTTNIYTKKEFLRDVKGLIEQIDLQEFRNSIILDSEIIGYDENTQEFIPFQQTISRRRKYNILTKAQNIPVRFYVFDIMFLGVDIVKLPFALRRFILETLFKYVKGLKVLALTPEHNLEFMDTHKAEDLFDYYVEAGLEGVMFKDPVFSYAPGVRNFAWIKYKRAMKGDLADTLDVVVLGYYLGRGRRASLGIGAFLIGVYDRDKNTYVSISKLGTGITDDQWIKLKKLVDKYKTNKAPVNIDVPKELKPDVWVYPQVVMVVEADEITKSPLHSAGFALRFPRFKQVRFDKDPEQATTKKEVEEMYNLSKNK